jgi:hypothetical protein
MREERNKKKSPRFVRGGEREVKGDIEGESRKMMDGRDVMV